jgi:hypothetical protein
MAISDLPAGEAAPPAAQEETAAHGLLLATFAAAIFVSAALLFMVQPMFTKLVLPRFGGAPSVWSVAIVFFQAALLAGYAYAHWLVHRARARMAVIIHVMVMIAACFWLPLAIASTEMLPLAGGEAVGLFMLLAASIGPPFFALAANSPLLQAALAHTDHPAAANPYFLFAGSNIGSFLALVSYPIVVEPYVRLADQRRYWSITFYLLIALLMACGILLWRGRDRAAVASAASAHAPLAGAGSRAAPTWRDAARWVALAAVPSGLLVAVTAHISTDVAAVPLLWVVPLAFYLLSFVIVFARRPVIPHRIVVAMQPFFIIGLAAVIIYDPVKTIVWLVAVHVAVFFVCALMCHGEIARTRPAPQFLTVFYLWMSAGGVLGGISAGLIAPHVFSWVAEYPILIALAVLCRPAPGVIATPHPTRLASLADLPVPGRYTARYLVCAALAAAGCLLTICTFFPSVFDETTFNRTAAVLLIACVPLWRAPPALAAIIASVLWANQILLEETGAISVRSFFGVAKIVESSDHQFRILQHGTTMHGAQRIRTAEGGPVTGPPEPLLYYWEGSAIAQTFDALRARREAPIRYAVIGLGAGSLACLAGPDDTVDYYEIDPAIVRIARDPKLFTFLSACRPHAPIVLGDARLTLAQAPAAAYDLIIVDAFSSDAIPVHLLTREAMTVYLAKLSAHGMIVMHISNRHLELASVVAGIAAANGLITLVNDSADVDEMANPYRFPGTVAAVARGMEDFGPLAQSGDWERTAPDPKQWVWTDDYSNVFGSVVRKLGE